MISASAVAMYSSSVFIVRDACEGELGGCCGQGARRDAAGGRGGIRTHEWLPIAGFQDRCLQPLGHSSVFALLPLWVEPASRFDSGLPAPRPFGAIGLWPMFRFGVVPSRSRPVPATARPLSRTSISTGLRRNREPVLLGA